MSQSLSSSHSCCRAQHWQTAPRPWSPSCQRPPRCRDQLVRPSCLEQASPSHCLNRQRFREWLQPQALKRRAHPPASPYPPAGLGQPSWQTVFEPNGSSVGYGCCGVGGSNADNPPPSKAGQAACFEGRSSTITSLPLKTLAGLVALSSVCDRANTKNCTIWTINTISVERSTQKGLIAVLGLNNFPLFVDSALNAPC